MPKNLIKHRPSGGRLGLWAIALFAMQSTAPISFAAPEGKIAPDEIITADREIDVTLQQTDVAIRQRITNILTTSQKFDDFSIDVEQGLVFLAGTTDDDRYVTWAEKIARNVKGVVAVLNQIEVAKEDQFSLAPLKNEVKNLTKSIVMSLPLVGLGWRIQLRSA